MIRSRTSISRGHRSPRQRRRGIALADVMVAGIMLGIGLGVVLSLSSRALRLQIDGERRLTAGWLADELLTMVLVDGPDEFGKLNDTAGFFDAPFDEYAFEVLIEERGRGVPYDVSAIVRWSEFDRDAVTVSAQIALRLGEEDEPLREPLESVDRESRYFDDEL